MAVTTAAVVGIAATAATTGASFAQAAKQKRAQREAERDADEAMQEAKKKLEINVYSQQAIKKEPYELAREQATSTAAQAIEAGRESERGSTATAGRIQMAQNIAQGDIRTAMGQDLTAIENRELGEESRLRDIGVQLDLEEAAGAQQAAANAAELSAQAQAQGMQGVISGAQQIASFLPLYSQTQSAKLANKISDTAASQYGLSQTDIQKSIASMGNVEGTDLSGVAKMSPMEYKTFMTGLDPKTLKAIGAKLPTNAASFKPEGYMPPAVQQKGFKSPLSFNVFDFQNQSQSPSQYQGIPTTSAATPSQNINWNEYMSQFLNQ